MTDLYLDQDESSPFFQEIFAERRNDAFLAHIRAGGSPLTFPRPARTSTIINLDDRVLANPGALK